MAPHHTWLLPRVLPEAPSLTGDAGRGGASAELHWPDSWLPWKRWNQAPARHWPSPGPLACSSPQNPHSDSSICPGGERGILGSADSATVYPSVALGKDSKYGSFGGPPGGGKGGNCWPILTQVPRHKQCP